MPPLSMRFIISLSLLALACLASAGCVSGRPVHYYTLGPPASPPVNQGKPDGLIILVGNITTTQALQDGRIRYRVGANEVGAYEYHRWTDRPGMLLRDAIVRTLRSSGKYQRVLESASAASGDYLIRGKLYEFDEIDNPEIHTRIALQIELIDRKTSHAVWDREFEHEEPASGKNIKDVVQSMDSNLQQVVAGIAAGIDQFVTQPR